MPHRSGVASCDVGASWSCGAVVASTPCASSRCPRLPVAHDRRTGWRWPAACRPRPRGARGRDRSRCGRRAPARRRAPSRSARPGRRAACCRGCCRRRAAERLADAERHVVAEDRRAPAPTCRAPRAAGPTAPTVPSPGVAVEVVPRRGPWRGACRAARMIVSRSSANGMLRAAASRRAAATSGIASHCPPSSYGPGAEGGVDGEDLAVGDVAGRPRLGDLVAGDGDGHVDVEDRRRRWRRRGTARSPTRPAGRSCPRAPRWRRRARSRRTGTRRGCDTPARPAAPSGRGCASARGRARTRASIGA